MGWVEVNLDGFRMCRLEFILPEKEEIKKGRWKWLEIKLHMSSYLKWQMKIKNGVCDWIYAGTPTLKLAGKAHLQPHMTNKWISITNICTEFLFLLAIISSFSGNNICLPLCFLSGVAESLMTSCMQMSELPPWWSTRSVLCFGAYFCHFCNFFGQSVFPLLFSILFVVVFFFFFASFSFSSFPNVRKLKDVT